MFYDVLSPFVPIVFRDEVEVKHFGILGGLIVSRTSIVIVTLHRLWGENARMALNWRTPTIRADSAGVQVSRDSLVPHKAQPYSLDDTPLLELAKAISGLPPSNSSTHKLRSSL